MGEFELLAKLRERLRPAGPRVRLGSGDDAAVTVPGGATATSVDAIVDGVHFHRGEVAPQKIGRKALASALSDLAAMGAETGEAYVVLGAPPDLAEDEFDSLLEGLLALAAETGTTLAGGDLTRAPALTLAVTVVGHARNEDELVPRSGAQPGDLLVLTGELGGAVAGRLLLDRPELGNGLAESTADRLRNRQLDPAPRLRSGRALTAAGARAMIDLSDGLAGDARHVAQASKVALRVNAESVPLAEGVAEIAAAASQDPLQLAVSGGEDYELLAALPGTQPQPSFVTDVGELTGEGAVLLLDASGPRHDLAGWDHFQ